MILFAEIITAITIILVGAILTLYLSILKKNGWIGEASNYRCPNPKCGKIFQVPMKVKDFSTGKEVGFACPECGYNLRPLNAGKGLKGTTLQSELELEIARESTVNGGIDESKMPVPTTHPKFKSEKSPTTLATVQTANGPHISKDTTISGVGAKEERDRLTCRTCKKESRTPLFTLEYAASTHALGHADL